MPMKKRKNAKDYAYHLRYSGKASLCLLLLPSAASGLLRPGRTAPTRSSSSSLSIGADGANCAPGCMWNGRDEPPFTDSPSSWSVGGALLSNSNLRRCSSCLSSVGSTCDDEARYSGAGPCGGSGGNGLGVSFSLLLTGDPWGPARIVREDPASLSPGFVTRRCKAFAGG